MNIVVISPSPRSLETLSGFLRSGAVDRSIVPVTGGISHLPAVAGQQRPELILVEGMCHDAEELGAIEQVTTQHPQTAVILLCARQSPEFLLQAMRCGVREVLPTPVTPEALAAAVARVEARRAPAPAPRRGQILALIACKGGSGATFLATNLAYQLAASRKVLLIDLNLQFGDAVLFVHDRRPATNLADVVRDVERLDAALLAASLVQVTPDYGLLAAPEDPGQAMSIRPEQIEALLRLAAAQYDFVILDVGRTLDAVTLKALDRADRIFPVLQMTLPFVRDASRLLAVFRTLGYAREKVQPLVNRFTGSGDLGLAEVERTLGVSGLRTIPNSYAAVAASVNQGLPIARMAKGNAVSRSLEDFARALLPAESGGNGWLGRLLRRA